MLPSLLHIALLRLLWISQCVIELFVLDPAVAIRVESLAYEFDLLLSEFDAKLSEPRYKLSTVQPPTPINIHCRKHVDHALPVLSEKFVDLACDRNEVLGGSERWSTSAPGTPGAHPGHTHSYRRSRKRRPPSSRRRHRRGITPTKRVLKRIAHWACVLGHILAENLEENNQA